MGGKQGLGGAIEPSDIALALEPDQRGFARAGLSDVGSLGAGADDGGAGLAGLDGLPPLAEKVPVDPSLINGVDAGLLRGDGATPFTVTFLGGVAAKDDALGYYIVQEDEDGGAGEEGVIAEAGILFESTEEAAPGARVQVDALEEGQTLGLFLVADGADLNGDRLAGDPDLVFLDGEGDPATVADPVPGLFLAEPGDTGPVLGPVLHASDFVAGDAGNALNPGGLVRALSGRGGDGGLLVAWEDQTSGSDTDFNDAIVRVAGPGPGTGIAPVELGEIAAGRGGGFALNGVAEYDFSGRSVSGGGDVNGDGLYDLIVGAPVADPNGTFSGQSYVVFGKADSAAVELADIAAGRGGFALNGAELSVSGSSVSGAGDVNGDGLADLLVGATEADPNGTYSGQSYVVFGKADAAAVELADVAAGEGGGFALNGVEAYDTSGYSLSGAGDVNGDGLADLIIGAPNADPNGAYSGQSYVVFGKEDAAAVELGEVAAGRGGGFALNGIDTYDGSGASVSGAGDVDGDGRDDLLVGATGPGADPNGEQSGQSYIVFGKADAAAVELADVAAGEGGFALNGAGEGDFAGFSVSGAGDVDGDGRDDFIIGARAADPNGVYSGQSYVVFGGDFLFA